MPGESQHCPVMPPAAAMGVSVADFVDVSAKPTVHLIAEDEIPQLWEGEKGGRRLLAGSGGPEMTELWMWEMQPGEKFASPGHTEGTLELFYVQTGTLTLGVQDHLYLVKTGCSATARTTFLISMKTREEPIGFHHDST
jgi:hypothetical protein